jgi:chromosome segregation ATPase
MWHSFSRFVVMAICMAIPCVSRADAPQNPAIADVQARLDTSQGRSHAIGSDLQNALAELKNIQQVIRDQTGLVDVDPETVHRLIATLQEQREQMELDAAGADGRREALEQAVAKLSKQIDDRVGSDQVCIELSKVVDIRHKQLERIEQLQKQGVAPQENGETAEASLASAQADLAAARQKAVSGSADALDTWNRQLLELTIAAQERTARLKYVNERLSKFWGISHALDAMEPTRAQITRLQQELYETVSQIDALTDEMNQLKLKFR